MLGTGLGMGSIALNKTDKNPALKEVMFWCIIANYLLRLNIKSNNLVF